MKDQIDIGRLMQALSEILTDRHGVKVTLTARPIEEVAA